MPKRYQLLGTYGNGLIGLFFVFAVGAGLDEGKPGLVMFGLVAIGFAIFNVYVIRKAAALLSEEEWLKAELRKAELRAMLRARAASANEPPPETRP